MREFLPQVRLLERSAVAVSHGGNNSVTEALTAGVPLLVLPLSTDQFAGAAAVERAGVGLALDPNAATPDDIHGAVQALLSPHGARAAAVEMGTDLREVTGARRAHGAVSARWPSQPGDPGGIRG